MKKRLDTYDKIQMSISYILRFCIVVFFIWELVQQDYYTAFLIAFFLVLTFIPAFLERNFKVTLPVELDFAGTVFIFLSLVLGEVHDAYIRFWWWDMMLHTLSGVILGFICFIIVYLVSHYSGRSVLSPRMIILFAFCMATTIGALWEYFEFFMTETGIHTMQHGNTDTMIDMILVSVGSLFSLWYGYTYLKVKKSHFIERILQKISHTKHL
ncbi:MAG: hypothetical protein ACMXYF_03135 [Candidatus Woesearchaeota archaeon]